MLIEEKQDKVLKCRACANGKKQREFADPAEAASPASSLDSMTLTVVMGAKEN